jgi:hypothetical protein
MARNKLRLMPYTHFSLINNIYRNVDFFKKNQSITGDSDLETELRSNFSPADLAQEELILTASPQVNRIVDFPNNLIP